MTRLRKIAAIGFVGVMLGASVSVFTAGSASARFSNHCRSDIDTLTAQAAKDYKKGRITKAQYDEALASIADHRRDWGC